MIFLILTQSRPNDERDAAFVIKSTQPGREERIMSEQPIGDSFSLQTVEMGLGAWSWGDRSFWHYGIGYTDEDIAAAFGVSVSSGIRLIDTAEVYGVGRSERMVGRLIHESPAPIAVATKFFPLPYRFTRRSVVRALRGSLERLGLERVALYQLHWPSPLVPFHTHLEGLAMAVKAGLVDQIGVSNYNLDQTIRAEKVLNREGVALASNQVDYNLLERQAEKSGLLDHCKEKGIRVIAYSPLGQGLLTGKYSPETPPPEPRGRRYAPILKNLAGLIHLLNEIGQGHDGKTAGQVALNWVICKGALPIPGAKTAAQATENVGALGWRLTSEEVHALDEGSDKALGE
jgi:aryl-alcohol dehydrogenase-like predicted oxidoreductase